MPTIAEIQQNRGQLVTQMRAIVDKADTEKREITAEERTEWGRLDTAQDDVRQVVELRQRQDSLDGLFTQSGGGLNPPDDNGEPRNANPPDKDAEMRKLLDMLEATDGGMDELRDDDRKAVEQLQRRAFGQFLTAGKGGGRIGELEQRALQADSDTGGGVLAPMVWVSELIRKLKDQVFIRDLARNFDVPTADSLGAPELANETEDATWSTEVKAVDEDTAMDLSMRELHPHPSVKSVKVSNKMLRVAGPGSPFDVVELVQDSLGYKFAITEEKGFLTGNGAGQPLGVFTASAQGISTGQDVSTGNSTTAIGADGLIEAKYAIKAAYMNDARWVFHRDAIKEIRKLKDGEGNYLWQAGLVGDRPDSILEVPFVMSEYAPNTFTTGLYVGLIGNFRYYWIATSLAMVVQRVDELYAETRQTGFIGDMEVDGMPVLEEAFVRVTLA